MKNHIIIGIASLAACCGTMPSLAQITEPARDRDVSGFNARYSHLGKLERASKLIGLEVRDSRNEKLGKVKDLEIDMRNGRIVEVIVMTSGMLGVDEEFVAAPPSQFTCDAEQKTLVLNGDAGKFKSAPKFKASDWDSDTHAANVAKVYQYYGATPYFSSDESGTKQIRNSRHLGELRRASKVIGMTAINPQNEKLGKVENLMVDLSDGRVVEVVLESGGFLGIGGELSAVPPQAFQFGTERGALTLDTTREALLNAPHFKSSEWSSLDNPDQVSRVYGTYHVDPYFTTNSVDNTVQNARDRVAGALTPLNQGTSPGDFDITRQIRKQIMATKGLSISAHNVKVITIDGRVTLRGPVNTEEEKRQILAIATKVASDANVNDQLQVKGSSTGE